MKQINPDLTSAEKHVIVDKGTERPYTGVYRDHHAAGTYLCRNCKAPLYRSDDKFDSGCGRPSFDQQLPGAVKRETDADGLRTEITCTTCWAHLWHVFIGEQMTEHNTRHCVNSISLQFVPDKIEKTTYKQITLWGGCFRCVEAAFAELEGIIETKVGYSGGKRTFPTYEHICSWNHLTENELPLHTNRIPMYSNEEDKERSDESFLYENQSVGATGHHEVVQITYDPKKITLAYILEIFFKIHDPTSRDKQGGDTGSQYRSVIFAHSPEQLKEVQAFINDLADEYEEPIVTEVKLLEKFRIAEGYHQNYFQNNPQKPYCQMVIKPKVEKVKKIQENRK